MQGKTKKVYLMSGVRCDGTESSLVSCDHAGWGRLECATGRPVVVTCIRANYSEVSMDNLLVLHGRRAWGPVVITCTRANYSSVGVKNHKMSYRGGLGGMW